MVGVVRLFQLWRGASYPDLKVRGGMRLVWFAEERKLKGGVDEGEMAKRGVGSSWIARPRGMLEKVGYGAESVWYV